MKLVLHKGKWNLVLHTNYSYQLGVQKNHRNCADKAIYIKKVDLLSNKVNFNSAKCSNCWLLEFTFIQPINIWVQLLVRKIFRRNGG